jgi:tetratricopeptide (TPR) repeat protein
LQAQPVDEQENPFAEINLEGNKALHFNELFFLAEKEKNLGNLREAERIYKELYTLNTTNATVCFELAQIYLTDENGADAIYYAERAHKLKPENRWMTVLLANVYRHFGESKKEVAIFKELLEDDPNNVGNYYELALAYLNNNEPQKALKALDKTEALIGINEEVINQKKQIYLQMGDVQGAIDEINKLIEAYPNNLDYYGNLAKIYEVNGFEERAIALYEKMLVIDPEDPRPHLDLALYYRSRKNMEKSLFHLKQAMASPNLDIDQKIPVLLSLFDASAKDSTMSRQTEEMLASVVAASPDDPKAHAIYGDWLSRNNKGEEALVAYKQAIRLEGGGRFQIWEQILLIQIQMQKFDSIAVYGPDAVALFPNQPLPYFFTGAAFNALERPREALIYLEDGLGYAMGNTPLKEQFYVQLADTYHRLKQHPESDAYFEKALALNPKNATALNNYAYYLSVRKEKLDRALKLTEESNLLSPKNPVFLDTWAWVLYQKGQYGEALKKMEEVIALSSELDAEVRMHYGDILFALKRNQEAKEQWQKALETGGDKSELNQRLKKVS